MNDRAQGTIEALAWTRNVLQETGSVKARRQIERALDMILKQVASDFQYRLKTY